MFWKYNSLAVSHLDTLLDKQTVTLAEILEQEDIIQECKSQNKKLVEYLTKQEILAELLDLILQEPPADLEERLRFKLPNIASEVITCDVPQINEKLSSDAGLLDKMYAFLEAPPPLNPLLTSFFSKAFGVLITRRPEQVIEYVKAKQGFVGLLLTHLATSAVMDLLLRLITCVEGTENKQNILTWLNDERLIPRVVALLSPPAAPDGGGRPPPVEDSAAPVEGVEGAAPPADGAEGEGASPAPPVADTESHDNVGQLLVEIIRNSRDAQITATAAERFHNPLLASAESPDTVRLLLGHMLDSPPVESTIVNGVEVLLALLEIRKPSPQGAGFYQYGAQEDTAPPQAELDRQQAVVESTVECIVARVPQLTAILVTPPPRAPVTTTAGTLTPPLGKARLAIARLLSALLATHHWPINVAVAQSNTTTILLDLFFKYSLNNFLHAQVESCIHSILFWKEKVEEVEEEEEPQLESSSLETPKIKLEGESSDSASGHPLADLEAEVPENPALVHLVTAGGLVGRLVAAWAPAAADPAVCYMGHVTRISNHVVHSLAASPLLRRLLAALPEETQAAWAALAAGRLAETNTLNELKPATEDKRTLSSDDEDTDFRDIQFPQESALQQMQEMSENFIDSFGFQEDEFTESEENVSRGMRKLNSVNFLMQTDDSTKQAIFDSVCEQRIKAFSSSPPGEGEDPWEDRTAELTFGAAKEAKGEDSSDEEQEMAPDRMEVDNEQDPWEGPEASGGGVAMDTSSPWADTPPAPAVAAQGAEVSHHTLPHLTPHPGHRVGRLRRSILRWRRRRGGGGVEPRHGLLARGHHVGGGRRAQTRRLSHPRGQVAGGGGGEGDQGG